MTREDLLRKNFCSFPTSLDKMALYMGEVVNISTVGLEKGPLEKDSRDSGKM